MALELVIGAAKSVATGLWSANLTPADVRRLGEARLAIGRRSIIGVLGPTYESAMHRLLIQPAKTTVFNVGDTDELFVIDLGEAKGTTQVPASFIGVQSVGAMSNGDALFLSACEREQLPSHLIEAAHKIIGSIRAKYAGQMKEGKARKWVNYPDNFLALVIQPRDGSFAVHVWGRPDKFHAQSLDIKRDRSRYSRFKLSSQSQVDDALRVILESARLCTGR
ncbi:MAG: hypothetical protein HY848_13105, partial [Betaproteobacteria bacterium]|nr:hypothetical protein [Betaproteobacteria bacterium]